MYLMVHLITDLGMHLFNFVTFGPPNHIFSHVVNLTVHFIQSLIQEQITMFRARLLRAPTPPGGSPEHHLISFCSVLFILHCSKF